ncbi:MAG: Glycosyltransferase, group 2 family protein [Candidatus Curtissbacteria bacterium GW2011_GWA1_40_16]|uniref:Glycosyltransferase, group 2 family protein n=1 Tax=Candidatus Curtissbacteria bacterium GW2011_GWA1_40_16 TaxID=1618405 RepID=A0A0G0R9E5_9BACT|nr:MAG: Glycosyltransferase, group 2 family protein [Candidatus Curtissbacteria bacterium GW2011_GWA1_40_16]
MNKNLLISVITDKSMHRFWINQKKHNYDVFLIYCGNKKNIRLNKVEFFDTIKGLFKLETIYYALKKNKHILDKYKYFFLPDDDIFITSEQINKLFNIAHQYNFPLCQPSLIGGFYSYPITIQNKYCKYRIVNFIEMLCPVMNRESIKKLLPTFLLNRSGWGVDLVWSKYIKKNKAIIDEVGVHHKTIGKLIKFYKKGSYYDNLHRLGISADREMIEIRKKFHVNRNKKIIYKKVYKSIFFKFLDKIKNNDFSNYLY